MGAHRMKRLAILLSGRGSNFEAIADSIRQGRLPARIEVVVSNRSSAAGLEKARRRGLKTLILPSRGVARKDYDRSLVYELKRHRVDLVCLAGFMRILGPLFVRSFPNRILNVHPSLLPAFPGLRPQRQALEYGVQFSGCTVHLVDEGVDTGPVLLQAAVPVLESDDEDSLAARILAEEHRLYPRAIGMLLRNEVRLQGRRVVHRY